MERVKIRPKSRVINRKGKNRGNGRFDVLTKGTQAQLVNLYSAIQSRAELAQKLGKSFKGNRDIYESLGIPKDLKWEDYWAYYSREGIAKKVVDILPDASWLGTPEITEDLNSETAFEKDWKKLIDKIKVWHYMARVDRLSGIGEYGIILLGFDDGAVNLEEPVMKAGNLIYMRPFKQNNVAIDSYVKEVTDERFGLPEIYQVKISAPNTLDTTETKVHWSRILHVADDLSEDDILGTPRLKNVFNYIAGLILVSGGCGEMFWRGAFPGLAFILDKDADYDPNQSESDLEDEINAYIHDLQRTVNLQGMSVQNLSPQVADPSNHVDVLMTLIAAGRGVPKRIFMGSERGELASTQDETAWNKKVMERRENYLTPSMIRTFIDRLIKFKVLTSPGKDGYTVRWPDISVPTEEEKAKVMQMKAEAISKYGDSIGGQEVLPQELFLKHVMGFDDDVIEQAETLLVKQLKEEEKEGKMSQEEDDDRSED